MQRKEVKFIKSMQIIIFSVVILSVIWNISCLIGFLPLKRYTATYAFVLIPSMIISVYSVFFRTKDTTNLILNVNKDKKVQAVIFVCLFFAWIITLIACTVY